MSARSALSDDDIRGFVSAESYRRGAAYFERGALKQLRRTGRVLRALCDGSRAEPYRVVIELGGATVEHAHCSCPVGALGRCKHVAACLLAWNEDPSVFVEVSDVKDALTERTRAELVSMIAYMMRREPELEAILGMRFPAEEPAGEELDVGVYRDQARSIFHEFSRGLGASSQIADALSPLVELAEGFVRAGDWVAAAKITSALIDEIAVELPNTDDADGFLDTVMLDLLERSREVLSRRDVARTARHVALGGLARISWCAGASRATARAEELMFSSLLEASDRQELAMHLRQMMQGEEVLEKDSWLLLQLESEHLPEDAFVERCRALGRRDALVRHLLEGDRIEPALEELAQMGVHSLLALLPEFAQRGHAERVEALVKARYLESGDLDLLAWLEERNALLGQEQLAMTAVLTRFYRMPSHELFERVMRSCVDPAQWELLRPSLLAFMREQGLWGELVRALISLGDVDAAFDAMKRGEEYGHISRDMGLELGLELADAARQARPRLSARLFRQTAEGLIEQRSLTSFKKAASLLAQARGVAAELGAQGEWGTYSEELLERYGRYQGLREALRAVGLLGNESS